MDTEVRVGIEVVLTDDRRAEGGGQRRGGVATVSAGATAVCTRPTACITSSLLSCLHTSADVLSFISLRLTSGAGAAAAAAGADMAAAMRCGAVRGSVRSEGRGAQQSHSLMVSTRTCHCIHPFELVVHASCVHLPLL